MSLDKIAGETIASIEQALGGKLSDDQREAVRKAVCKSLTDTVEHTGRKHRRAAQEQCGPDADLAHKIADEIRRANLALMANLESLR